MKSPIIVDGEEELYQNLEFQARLRAMGESIRARHAAELAKAGFFRRLVLRWRIAAEMRASRKKMMPSPGSLFVSEP